MNLGLDPEPMYFTTMMSWFNTVISKNPTLQRTAQPRVRILEKPVPTLGYLIPPTQPYPPHIHLLPTSTLRTPVLLPRYLDTGFQQRRDWYQRPSFYLLSLSRPWRYELLLVHTAKCISLRLMTSQQLLK